MNHLTEEDLILIYYGEDGVPENSRSHLTECAQCRAAADSLARTLDLCGDFRVPEPPVEFGRRMWERLFPRHPAMPRWMGFAAAAVLLIGAFLLGRQSRTVPPSLTAGLSNQARERILEISLADHLDRAGMLITEISNDNELATERGRAQDLVEEGRLLRQTLAREGDSSTLAFVDELERFMIEAAHTSDTDELRQRISADSLLFKVRIIESNLRTQGQKS